MALPIALQTSRNPISITIKTRRLPLDDALRRAIQRHLRSALGRFSRRIRMVFVWLEDVNGPREGSGVRCRMNLSLRPRGRLTVLAEAPRPYAAVGQGALRARALLDRHVKRRRRLQRRPRVAVR